MIAVSFYRDQDGIRGFTFEGHADAGEKGYDIVCSAVSALTIGTVNALESLTGVGFDEEAEEEGGYLSVALETADDHDSQLLMRALELAVTQLADSYPDNVWILQEDC